MSVLILLIVFSLVVAIIFLGAFLFAVRSGQFDDTYTPSVRVLFDDTKKSQPKDSEETPSDKAE
jgi:cbb3-type cytochrome oxidase maturation protein